MMMMMMVVMITSLQTFQQLEGAGIHQHGNSEEHGSRHCMQRASGAK